MREREREKEGGGNETGGIMVIPSKRTAALGRKQAGPKHSASLGILATTGGGVRPDLCPLGGAVWSRLGPSGELAR